MKHFRFTLQALLTVRQREERDALENYARKLQTRQQALDDLAAIENDLALAWNDLRHQMIEGTHAAALLQRQAHCHHLGQQREQRLTLLSQAEEAANLALLTVLTARQNREVVEKFLDQQRKNYQRECNREEQKLLDELAHRAGPDSVLDDHLHPDPIWN